MWKDVSAKYRVIIRFKEKYPIQKMCELFKVSRSGFYKWKKRASQPQQRSELDQFIIECQAQVKQSYGRSGADVRIRCINRVAIAMKIC